MNRLVQRLGPTGTAGLVLLVAVVGVSLLGPWLAPYGEEQLLSGPYEGRSGDFPLGTDVLGRDVWSRVLRGGRSTLVLATLSVLVAYAIGVPLGAVAAYNRGVSGRMVLAALDMVLVVPGLILLMVLTAAIGAGARTILIVAVLFNAASIGRITFAAAQPVAAQEFVSSAVLRGQGTVSIVGREILPNVRATLGADIGLRFTVSVLIIAGANFLGFGLQSPAADWGVMAAENRAGLAAQPLAVLVPVVFIAALSVSVSLISDALTREGTSI